MTESAISQLRASDVLLSQDRVRAALAAAGMDERAAEHMPHAALRWAAESDKMGLFFISPVGTQAREELDLYLSRSPRLGVVPLFPAPGRRAQTTETQTAPPPISRDLAAKWLLCAEKLAELPKLVGGTFHPYRRLWATERKNLPLVDVAAAGGWSDTQSLRVSYQQADPAAILRVVTNSG